jgi:hypothetical protein
VSYHYSVQILKDTNVFSGMDLVTSKENSTDFDETAFANGDPFKFNARSANKVEHRYDSLGQVPPVRANSFLSTASTNIWPVEFAIWVQAPGQEASIERSLHTYSRLQQASQSHEIPLDDVSQWRSRFPYVSTLQQQGGVGCHLIMLDCTLDVMASLPSTPSVLGAQFEVISTESFAYQTVQCATKIYSSGRLVWDRTHTVPTVANLDGTTKLKLPYASDFWSVFFTGLFSDNKSDNSQREAISSVDKIQQAIQNITLVHEIVASGGAGTCGTKRVAVFLWDFHKAISGRTPNTTWRHLIPPPTRILNNSPHRSPYSEQQVSSEEQAGSLSWTGTTATPISLYEHDGFEAPPASPAVTSANCTYFSPYSQDVSAESLEAPSESRNNSWSFLHSPLPPYNGNNPYLAHAEGNHWNHFPPAFAESGFPISMEETPLHARLPTTPDVAFH